MPLHPRGRRSGLIAVIVLFFTLFPLYILTGISNSLSNFYILILFDIFYQISFQFLLYRCIKIGPDPKKDMACFPPHVAVLGRVRTLGLVVRQQSIDVSDILN